jgi:hypothetical protein
MPDDQSSLMPLAPTADLPEGLGRSKETPAVYRPCVTCGVLVLRGVTRQGEALLLEPGVPTYVVQWDAGAPQPTLAPSRGYPVHRCVVLAPAP